MSAPEEIARGIVALAEKHSKPLIACWMGEREVASARELFRAHRIPEYRTPEAAVDAFHVLAAHHRNQALVLQTPDSLSRGDAPDIEGATMIIEGV
ncbi:MAG: GNAT family N-acetyltransferase, partial [Phycisphaerae bacterium]